MTETENDKIKLAYYGAIVESTQALIDSYKRAVKQNENLHSIEYLEFLATTAIVHAEDMLRSFELGRNYLEYYKQKQKESITIKTATFTSVWDGEIHNTTPCKVNMDTKEVFDIEPSMDDNIEALTTLDREYVTIDDIDYPVHSAQDSDHDGTGFWYNL